MVTRLFIILILFLNKLNASEQAGSAELMLSHTSVQRGQSILAGIRIKTPVGFHSYWKNPGESGLRTEVKWNNPKLVTVSPLEFPVPQFFNNDGMLTFGYPGEVILIVQLTIDADTELKEMKLELDVDWLACKWSCIPGHEKLSATITIGESRESKEKILLNNAVRKLPKYVVGKVSKVDMSYHVDFESKQQLLTNLLLIPEDGEQFNREITLIESADNKYGFVIDSPQGRGLLIWVNSKKENKSLSLAW